MNKTDSILIRGGHLWSANDNCVGDIYIEDGKIRAIGSNLNDKYSAQETIYAGGLYVFPGGIDVHTHMELPFMGTSSADDFETGTLAGLHGGTTSIIDFAIQTKGESLGQCLNEWHERANKAVSDYAFHIAITEFNEKLGHEIPEIIDQGVSSFKAFMSYKGALMIDDSLMMALMKILSKYGGLLGIHAENGDIIDSLVRQFKKEKKLSTKYHPLAHPAIAEQESSSRAMDLAYYSGFNGLYCVHTSVSGVMDNVHRNLLMRNQRVLIETCPQYLLLEDSVYEKPNFEGAKYVMSPPIRKANDQKSLWNGLASGLIQVVATDHCPFNFKGQKDMGKDDFSQIPNGAAGIENRIELLFSEGVKKNRISMQQLVAVCATNPANIFGMENKGSLAIGKDADITLFDPTEKHTISARTHHHNVDSNIFEGMELTGKVKTVISNGKIAIRDGKSARVERSDGKFIKRKPFKGV